MTNCLDGSFFKEIRKSMFLKIMWHYLKSILLVFKFHPKKILNFHAAGKDLKTDTKRKRDVKGPSEMK